METQKSKPTFSIIVPVHNRPEKIERCLNSLVSQDYPQELFEVIVVDDFSQDDTPKVIQEFVDSYDNVLSARFDRNRQRAACRNRGLELAKNDWIVWCDSDDALLPIYLKMFAKAIENNPTVSLFTCGASVYNDRNMTFRERPAYAPEVGEKFKAGYVGTGSFIFRREEAFILPESERPYGDDTSFSAKVQKECVDMQSLYGQNPSGEWLPLGNPWGDDYAQFWMLTRTLKPKSIEMPLYLQFVRH